MNDTAVDEQFGSASAGGSRAALEAALAELPERQRRVLSLQYLAGLDELEVAEALAMSVRAVRRHAARGAAALRAPGWCTRARAGRPD